MTVDVRPKDSASAIHELSVRLFKVEQRTTSPGTNGSGGMGSDPVVNTITVGGIVVGSDASPATNLVLSTGAFMEDIWVDADWDAPADGTASNYDVELAKTNDGGISFELVQNFHTGGGTSLRMSGLLPGQEYGVRVIAINRIGARATPVPEEGFSVIMTSIDATIPAEVTGLTLTPGVKTIVATWDEVPDRDVARGTGSYQIQLASNSTFTIGIKDEMVTGTITAFTGLITNSFYWCRIRAVDNSGNAGPWSPSVSTGLTSVGTVDLADSAITTAKLNNLAVSNDKLAALAVDAAKLADSAVTSVKIANLAVGSAAIAALAVGTAHIADAAITNAKIGNLQVTTGKIADLAVDNAKIASLDAAKINAGVLNADRIAANSLDVNKLTTSTLTSKTITIGAGGALKIGNAPTTGLLINDQGLRLYNAGVVKMALDVLGTATFEGNISASTITSSTLTSATINSGTITGTTVRTAASGKRISMEAGVVDVIRFYSGQPAETAPGVIAIARTGAAGSQYRLDMTSVNTGNDRGNISAVSQASASDSAGCALEIFRQDGSIKSSINLFGQGNSGTSTMHTNGISEASFHMVTSGSIGNQIRLLANGIDTAVEFYANGFGARLVCSSFTGTALQVTNYDSSAYAPIHASAFTVGSARHTKTDIRPDSVSGLDRIRRMKPVKFKRKDSEEKEPIPTSIGFIAEDMVEVVPEAVKLDPDGNPIGIELSALLAVAIQAIQELALERREA